MNFNWDCDTMRWYQEANEYTDFFKKLARAILPKLEKKTHLCDVGCGLGLIDLELSQKVEKITAIDINEKVLQVLDEQIKKKEIINIEPKRMDYQAINDSYDVMLLSFFAGGDIDFFRAHAKKVIIIIDQKTETKPFIDQTRTQRRKAEARLLASLAEKDLDYQVKRLALEFGQPLRSRQEATAYMKKTYPSATEDQRSSYLSEQLRLGDDQGYPYYLPRKKALAIFEIAGK